jgi:hypothetical protein
MASATCCSATCSRASNEAPASPEARSKNAAKRARIKPHAVRNCGSLRPQFLPRLASTSVLYQYWGCTMPKRTAPLIAAIFVNLLAGSALAATSDSTANGADSCVAAPTGAAPQGGHWYYRIDWPTKRHCWYVRVEREKPLRLAPQDSATSAPAVSPQAAAAPPSVADARAQMPWPQPGIAQDPAVAPTQRVPAAAAEAVSADQGTDATPRSTVASRWPDPSEVSTSAGVASTAPVPAAGNPAANVLPAPPTARPAVTLAAADSSSAKQSSSIAKLLTVIVGALSVVAVMGSSLFRSSSTRRIAIDRRPPPIYPNSGAGTGSRDPYRDTRAADDPSRRIAKMLARLQQSAPG